jgi:phage terminase small subunit
MPLKRAPKATPAPNKSPLPLLSPRHASFVHHYIITGNATEAAKLAGYSAKAAASQGHFLLRNPKIEAEISKRRAKLIDKYEVTEERLVRELAYVGFANMANYMVANPDGSPGLDFSNLTREQTAALEQVTIEEFRDGRSDNRGVRRVKFKLASKIGALELLGKKLGLFSEKVEHQHSHQHQHSLMGQMLKEIDDEARKRPLIEHDANEFGGGAGAVPGPDDVEAA